MMMTQTMTPAPSAPKATPKLTHATAKAPRAMVMPTFTSTAPAPTPRTPPDSRVELVRLDDTTWRVCDSSAVPGQRGYIVGYLQRCEVEYEMLWMHPRPGVVHRHPDFDEALRAISTRLDMQSR